MLDKYKQVVAAQKKALPDNMVITETSCKVPLQDLLDHTVKRLIEKLELVLIVEEAEELTLDVKYGFDGTNVSAYKQKSENKENKFEDLICTSIVPLRLINKQTNKIYWKNSHPFSTSLCRPVELRYKKETAELSKSIEEALKNEIDALNNVEVENISVRFNMLLTMIDGKVNILMYYIIF